MNKGFTLLELLIVVVILGILALLATPILLNIVDTSKTGIVRGNINVAASSINAEFASETPQLPSQIATKIAAELNSKHTNPIDKANPAFVDHADSSPGTVVLWSDNSAESVSIQGYDKKSRPILDKPKLITGLQK